MGGEYDYRGRSHQGPASTHSHSYAASHDVEVQRTPAQRAADITSATRRTLRGVAAAFERLSAAHAANDLRGWNEQRRQLEGALAAATRRFEEAQARNRDTTPEVVEGLASARRALAEYVERAHVVEPPKGYAATAHDERLLAVVAAAAKTDNAAIVAALEPFQIGDLRQLRDRIANPQPQDALAQAIWQLGADRRDDVSHAIQAIDRRKALEKIARPLAQATTPEPETADTELRAALGGESVEADVLAVIATLDGAERRALAERFRRYRPGAGDDIAARFVRLDAAAKTRITAELGREGQTRRSEVPAAAAAPDVVAAEGIASAGGTYPHLDRIQRSFGSHDLSGIQAHIGGKAAEAATALGAEAYARGNAVAFRAEPSAWLAAHEAAHVVQQRRGVHVAGGIDGGATDPHEQHANAVADAVVAGRSAEALLGSVGGGASSAPSVQRFAEDEHKPIGDDGSGGATYKFPGVELSHGDLVMLSGDHFAPADLERLVNVFSPQPGQLPNTQDEIFYVLFTELGTRDPRFAPGGVWAHWAQVKFSDKVKKSVEERFYKGAQNNFDHFSNPRGLGSAGSEGSAGGTYRTMHEKALHDAYVAGRNGNSSQPALVQEAMGQHFLTDSFASGHVSTPRKAISDYWNKKYPTFGQQFLKKIAHDVAVQLASDATGLSSWIPVSVIENKTKDMILAQLGAKPLPNVGDIVALTTHGADNRDGLRVGNDLKWNWNARGDHKLEPPDDPNAVEVPTALQAVPPACTMSNRNIAVAAVQLGIDDVKRAYALGQDRARSPMTDEALFQHIRQHPSGLANPGPKYAPEQLVPRLDTVGPDQGTVNWMADSLEALWVTQIRTTKPETYGDFIANDMLPGGQMGGELEAIRAKLDETSEPFPRVPDESNVFGSTGGSLFPRRAFDKAVLQRVRHKATCLAYLLEIIRT